ncbi:MAG: hypothetical protein GX604_07465 [Actinobacteria bacterium]|nr:hypothetical protein [Actinomycetota bacterium]
MSKFSSNINLHELALSKGQRIHRTIEVEMAPIELSGECYQVVMGTGGVEVGVERISGGFLVTIAFDACIYGPCFRCLREAALEMHPAQEEFIPLHADEWNPGDISPFVADMVVDVAGLAREALMLSLPTKILCEESCPGVCPSCGQAGHDGPCAGTGEEIDSRWSRLRELRLGGPDASLKTDEE